MKKVSILIPVAMALMALCMAIPAMATPVQENFDDTGSWVPTPVRNAYFGLGYVNGFRIVNAMRDTTGGYSTTGSVRSAPWGVRLRDVDRPDSVSTSYPYIEYIGSDADSSGKDGGVGTFSFWWKKWSATTGNKFKISYKVGTNPWVDIDSVTVTGSDATWHYYERYLNLVGDNIRVRVTNLTVWPSGSNSAKQLDLDDFYISDYGSITILSPNGGERWLTGDVHDITWTSETITGNVWIQLYGHDQQQGSWAGVADVPNTGSYAWTVTRIANYPSYHIGIMCEGCDFEASDISDADFTIEDPHIQVTSPYWDLVSTRVPWLIQWQTNLSENMSIEVNRNFPDGPWEMINASIPAVADIINQVDWTPTPGASSTWNNARVRIRGNIHSGVEALSEPFTLFDPSVHIQSPNGGEKWVMCPGFDDMHRTISWTQDLPPLDTIMDVVIDISRDYPEGAWERIGSGFGELNWAVNGPHALHARIRAISVAHPFIGDTSDADFEILFPSLAITSPHTGDTLLAGSVDTVRWTTQDFQDTLVSVEVDTWDGSSFYSSGIPAALGEFSFSVPGATSIESAQIYMFAPDYYCESPRVGVILVPQSLTLTHPNGGESLTAGEHYAITWIEHLAQHDSVSIEVRRDEYWMNDIWEPIATVPAQSGSFDWTVAGPRSTTASIRITSRANPVVRDSSDAYLAIIGPSALILTSPNGGEVWSEGQSYNITWNSNLDPQGQGYIELNRHYPTGDWEYIGDLAANNGVFSWLVTSPGSSKARIRISSSLNGEASDTSDANFTIDACSGGVSGVWPLSRSPIRICGDVTVEAGDTLIIEPGVRVEFLDHYSLTVNGVLRAIGTQQDSIFFTCDTVTNSNEWGGIRMVNASDSCKMEYCVIENGNDLSYSGGGGLFCDHASPIVTNSTLRHNTTNNAGGAIYLINSNAVLSRNTIRDNRAEYDGGGVVTQSESAPLIVDCRFDNNSAGGHGGGMIVWDGRTHVLRSSFTGNRAAQWGGGVYSFSGSSPEALFEDCDIRDNISNVGGGVYLDYGPTELRRCTIVGNAAEGTGDEATGGGISASYDGPQIIDSCRIDSNSTTGTGGGISSLWGQHDFTHSTIRGNQSGSFGGGVYLNAYSSVGAISAHFLDCDIQDNISAAGGGGIMVQDSAMVSLERCKVVGNSAGNSSNGGGIECSAAIVSASNCLFSGNQAYNGGGLCFDDASRSARMSAVHKGGGLVSKGARPLSNGMRRPSKGAGLPSNRGGQSLVSEFHGDNPKSSQRDGGGSSDISFCTIVGNSSTNQGGGVYCQAASAPLALRNTIIASSTQGGAVQCSSGGSPWLTHCDLFGNTGGDWADCIADQQSVNGNLNSDPLFLNAASGDYHLADNSPCISAAEESNTPATDIEGSLRPNPAGTTPDIGAYENSHGSLSITMRITLTAPNGTESWNVGETHDIVWTSRNVSGDVTLELNRSFPSANWEVIAQSVPNTGSYTWVLSGQPTTAARVRILSTGDPSVGDTSNADFTISETCMSGQVAGTWQRSQSPIRVCGDVTVATGDILTIEPGVRVEFQGHYRLTVNGLLRAIGTVQDSVLFTCDTIANSNRWWGIRMVNASDSCRLEFCVVENGSATGEGQDGRGGGIFCDHTSPTITKCAVRNNRADSDGAGLCLLNANAIVNRTVIHGNYTPGNGGGLYAEGCTALAIDSCVVDGNQSEGGSSGGAMRLENSDVHLLRTMITGNLGGESGGIRIAGGSLTMQECDVRHNTNSGDGGGLAAFFTRATTIDRCRFLDNHTSGIGGGVYGVGANVILKNSLFLQNEGLGTLSFESAVPNLINSCTISQNIGSGIACWYGASPVIRNSIIATNLGGAVQCWDSVSVPIFGHSDLHGNAGGDWVDFITSQQGTNGNLNIDPLFVNTSAGDFHLTDASHCIGAGDTTGMPSIDLSGDPRPNPAGSRPDIGAFENTRGVPLGITAGPVAFWPLNGNGADSSGNGFTSVLYGTTPTTDRFGNSAGALHFNGTTDYVNTTWPGILGSHARTVSMWMRSSTATSSCALSYGLESSGGTFFCGFNQCGGEGVYRDVNAGSTLSGTVTRDNIWHHYVWVVPDTATPTLGTMRIYKDGVQLTASACANGLQTLVNTQSGQSVTLGRWQTVNYLAGDLDEVRIYDRALSSAEIAALYGGGAPSLMVTSPNGSEDWLVGESHSITWTWQDVIGNINIELNRSYPGGVWEQIKSDTSNTGSYNWTVTGTATNSARIRVTSATNPAIGDTSNGNFVITSAPPTVWSSQINGTTSALNGVSFVDANNGWAVGAGGIIRHTTNGGVAWTGQGSGTSYNLYGVSFADVRHGWVSADRDAILRTTNGGASWTMVSFGTNALYGVASTDTNNVWVVGDGADILHSTNGGTTWTLPYNEPGSTLQSVAFADVNDGWAVGAGGIIRHTTDGGITWTAQISGTTGTLYGVAFADVNNGWAVGSGGAIIHTTNGGNNWTTETSGTALTLHGVAFVDVNDGWAVGSGGLILYTTNGGSTWAPQVSGTASNLYGADFVNAGYGWTVGDGGTVLHYTGMQSPTVTVTSPNGGETWAIGDSHTITWTSHSLTGNVSIHLNRNYPSGNWDSLATVPAIGGSLVSAVTGPATTTARIRISSVDSPGVADTSNANFTIAQPSIALTSPNGAESWYVGQTHAISWTSQILSEPIKIEVNRTFPTGSWESIASNAPNTGLYNWLVSGPISAAARVRVSGTTHSAISDTSDADFRIAAMSIVLAMPNGGDTVLIAQPYAISWTSEGPIDSVKIELNRGYPSATWETITAKAPNSGSFTWSPMWPSSASCRVRITSLHAPIIGDTSDANFTIPPPPAGTMPGVVSSPFPVNGEANTLPTPRLSWSPAAQATMYDLYFWPDSAVRPVIPSVPNLTTSYYQVATGLLSGHPYKWSVTAKNAYGVTPGPEWRFTVRDLPDLRVDTVMVTQAWSGQPMRVTWQVSNHGNGATNTPEWFDRVWLSPDSVIDIDEPEDHMLGAFGNIAALAPGESYTNTQTVQIPADHNGSYYIFVISDNLDALFINWNTWCAWSHSFGPVIESNECNNFNYVRISISASPTPDLQVTSILTAPNAAFSGDTVRVQWNVRNFGSVPTQTGSWSDGIYFSPDSVLNDSARSLGTQAHTGILGSDSVYQAFRTVRIPNAIYGTYYVIVKTDVNNNIFEAAADSNNADQHVVVAITLAPPPDLVLDSIVAPIAAGNRETIALEWRVRNQGPGAPFEPGWNDRVYLSTDTLLDVHSDIVLGTFAWTGALPPGGTYMRQGNVTIPNGVAGAQYILVMSDYNNQVFENGADTNNVGRSPAPIMVSCPDLAVTAISNPSSASSGQNINVQWTVGNFGPGALLNGTWNDRIYISQNPVLDPGTATVLATVARTGDLPQNVTYQQQRSVTLANGISGTYYVYVKTDWNDLINENGLEANNTRRSDSTLSVSISPWADLQVTSIQVPADITAGNMLSVTFTVADSGTAAILSSTSWTDKVFLSSSPTWNPSSSTELASTQRSGPLAVNASYNTFRTWTVTTGLSGTYYVYVQTDVNNSVYEYIGESNNFLRSTPLTIHSYPAVDLAVSSITIPDSAWTGQAVTVQWSVRNGGAGRTLVSSWIDAAYLSVDTAFNSGTDLALLSATHYGALDSNQSYSESRTVTLPNGLSGAKYVIFRTDINGVAADANLLNNVRPSAQAMAIQLTPWADLQITSFIMDSAGTAGQPVNCQWTVVNNGTGTTLVSPWYDAVYLSLDTLLDAGDTRLATFGHSGPLAPGQSYTLNASADLPSYAAGNYYLLLRTDQSDVIYEYNSEGNNTQSRPVGITLLPPSDLIVTDIAVPDSASPGDSVSVSWTLRNIGMNPAVGIMRDGVYFSTDTVWSLDDPLLALSNRTINIAPGSSLNLRARVSVARSLKDNSAGILDDERDGEGGSAHEELPGLTPGDYHAIVRTDLRDNIRESDNNNNTGVSAATMNVGVPALPIGMPQVVTLSTGAMRYYRVDVAAGLDLQLTLSSSVNGAMNELYASFNQTPTLLTADFRADEPFTANQELLIPSTQAGTYYIMAMARSLPIGNAHEQLTLTAHTLQFSVLSISPDQGGTDGSVTCTIHGAGFDSTLQVFLSSTDTTVAGKILGVQSRMEAVVNFDLRHVPEHTYDVTISRADRSGDVLQSGFTVAPQSGSLELTIQGPSLMRTDRDYQYDIYANNGANVDMTNARILTQIPAGVEYKLSDTSEYVSLPSDAVVEAMILQAVPGSTQSLSLSLRSAQPLGTSSIIAAIVQPESHIGFESGYLGHLISSGADSGHGIALPPTGTIGYDSSLLWNWASAGAGYFEYFRTFDAGNMPFGDAWGVRLDGDSMAIFCGLMPRDNEGRLHPGTGSIQVFRMAELMAGPVVLWDGLTLRFEHHFSVRPESQANMPAFADRIKRNLPLRRNQQFSLCDHQTMDSTTQHCPICNNQSSSSFDNAMWLAYHNASSAAPSGTIEDVLENWLRLDQVYIKVPVDILGQYDLGAIGGDLSESFRRRIRDGRTLRIRLVASQDPNDIFGPVGFGDGAWVAVEDPCLYTIHFENEPTRATAPAQVVQITVQLNSTVSMNDFRLGSFGFANMTFHVPENQAYYAERLDLRDSLGVFVDVMAGVDVNTRQAFWNFQSIDPATGQQPVNPLIGFLQVNDPLLHRGEGFANYVIKPNEDAQSGDRMNAQASILFDRNEPITTRTVFNTVDAGLPVSAMDSAFTAINDTTVILKWHGQDDAGGSGIADYAVYLSVNDGPFGLFASGLTDTFMTFNGNLYNRYAFFTIARDNVNHVETMKTRSDMAMYFVLPAPAANVTDLTVHAVQVSGAASVILRWSAVHTDTSGGHITVDEYRIYSVTSLSGVGSLWQWIGSTQDTSYSFAISAGDNVPRRFFQVIAMRSETPGPIGYTPTDREPHAMPTLYTKHEWKTSKHASNAKRPNGMTK